PLARCAIVVRRYPRSRRGPSHPSPLRRSREERLGTVPVEGVPWGVEAGSVRASFYVPDERSARPNQDDLCHPAHNGGRDFAGDDSLENPAERFELFWVEGGFGVGIAAPSVQVQRMESGHDPRRELEPLDAFLLDRPRAVSGQVSDVSPDE